MKKTFSVILSTLVLISPTFAFAADNPITGSATGIIATDATLNATNGTSNADGHSFWASLASFSTASPVLPLGVYSTIDLGALPAAAPSSALLSSMTGMPPVTPNTTYYFAAWSLVGGNWYPGSVESFTTLALTQTISPVVIPAKTYGDSDFDPAYTASSGLSVTYTSTTPLVCTVVGNMIHIVAAGSCSFDADQVGNGTYDPAPQVPTTITVAQAPVNVTGISISNKDYDGTPAATISGVAALSGVLPADAADVVLDGAPVAQFADKHFGAAKPVTVSGYSISGLASSNYLLSQPTGLTADIAKLAITVTAVTDTRAFNNTTSSAGTPTYTALAPGTDTFSPTQVFADKNVATNKTLSSSSLVNDGNGGANYFYTYVTNSTGEITAAPVTPVITASDKAYDGNNSASATCALTGVIAPNVVTCSIGGTTTFADAAAGTGKTVTATGIILGGADMGNYALTTNTAIDTANITPLSITPNFSVDPNLIEKIYDGSIVVTVASTTLNTYVEPIVDTRLPGDEADFVVTSANYDTKHIGTDKAVTVTIILSGAEAGNYTLTAATDTDTNAGKITVRDVTVTAVTDTKVFDGATVSAVSPTATLHGTDTLTASQSFDTAAVGTGKTLSVDVGYTINDGNGGLNYNATTAAVSTGVILPVPAITIVNPSTDPAQTKTLTATASDGTLLKYVSNSAVCDGTIATSSFAAYSDTTFTSESDNGSFVCFRVYNILDNQEHLASAMIAGIDTTAPTITLATGVSDPTNNNPMPFTAVLSDAASSTAVFDLSDISVTNGTAGNLSVGPTNYTFDVTPSADGVTVSVSVAAASFTDYAGNGNTVSNTVTRVFDSSAPSVTISSPLANAETNQLATTSVFAISGAMVSPTSVVSCQLDAGTTVTCDSQSSHALSGLTEGSHTLAVGVSDTAGNSSTSTVTFIVDTTLPTITVPANITMEATAAMTPVTFMVSYADPTSSSVSSGVQTSGCDFASGDTFSVGLTTVTCNAIDEAGNAAAATPFTITITDTTAPVVAGMGTTTASSQTMPLAVTYTNPTATDLVDGVLSTTCTPASGSAFNAGETVVTCTATDAHSNTGSITFNVVVTQTSTNGPPSGSTSGNGPITGSVGGGGGGGGGSNPVTPLPLNGQVLGASTSTVSSTSTNMGTGTTTATSTMPVATSTEMTATTTTSFDFTKNMRQGSRVAPDVVELQKVLIAKGFLTIDSPTGYFGRVTRDAVIAYQRANALPTTGIVGPLTRAALNAGK